MKCRRKFGTGPISLLALLALTLFSDFEASAATRATAADSGWSSAGGAAYEYGANPASGSAELRQLLSRPYYGGGGGSGSAYPPIALQRSAGMSVGEIGLALGRIGRGAGGWIALGTLLASVGGEFLDWLKGPGGEVVKPGGGYSLGNCPSQSVACSVFPAAGMPEAICYAFNYGGVDYYRAFKTSSDKNSPDSGYTPFMTCSSYIVEWRASSLSEYDTLVAPPTDADWQRFATGFSSTDPAVAGQRLHDLSVWQPDSYSLAVSDPAATQNSDGSYSKQGQGFTSTDPTTGVQKTVTPGTKADPAADGQSWTIYNYNTTTTYNPTTGETSQTTQAEQPNLEIPDDYARESTAQQQLEVQREIQRQLDASVQPQHETAPEFSAALQTFFARLKTAPLLVAIDAAVPDSGSGDGACPVGHFTAFDTNYTIDAHCDLYEENKWVITTAMLAVWSLLALLFLLSA